MKSISEIRPVLALAGMLALGAVGAIALPVQAQQGTNVIAAGNIPNGNGVVKDITLVSSGTSSSSSDNSIGLGTVAGAVVGGVVGNQIGSGTGRTVATVAGAAGGAYVGHQLEKGPTTTQSTSGVYEFVVRMNSGALHTLRHEGKAGYRVGDHVRIRDGKMSRIN